MPVEQHVSVTPHYVRVLARGMERNCLADFGQDRLLPLVIIVLLSPNNALVLLGEFDRGGRLHKVAEEAVSRIDRERRENLRRVDIEPALGGSLGPKEIK